MKKRNWYPVFNDRGRVAGIVEEVAGKFHVSVDGIHCGVVGSREAALALIKRVTPADDDGGES
jgi:hypothetical protein